MSTPAPRNWPYPGSGWWKFDFHTHTPASSDFGKGPDQAALRQMSPKEWLLGFMRAEIDCVAVTDHNSGAWIDPLKQALAELEAEKHPEFRRLTLFPGVEITANGGVHVLAIFDPGCTGTDIEKLLAVVKYRGVPGESAVAADRSAIEVVEEIEGTEKAIPILAHADSHSGAFKLLNGGTLAPLLDSPSLFAVEISDPTAPKPACYTDRKLAWAEVLGSDSHHPSGPNGGRFPGSHFTWVKMEQPSLEGLYYALLDGNGVSIRRSDDIDPFQPFSTPDHFIESIEVANARFMGRQTPEVFRFSPWFNALIGGRGTGKSTVIHVIRKVYRREAELRALGDQDIAARTFEAFDRTPRSREDNGGWHKDGKSRLTLTLMRDGVRYRLNWAQTESGVAVEEETPSGWKASASQAITAERFPLRLFSQGQISSLASERSHALLGLIDQAIGAASYKAAIEEEQRRYLALCANERELVGKLGSRGALIVQLEDVRRKLERFEKERHADVLRAYQRKTRQEREVARQLELVENVANQLEAMAAGLVKEDLPQNLFDATAPADAAVLASVGRLHQHIAKVVAELSAMSKSVRELIGRERQALTQSAWDANLKVAKQRYTDLIAALKSQGVNDPSEYGKLVQDRQRLEGDIAKLDAMEKQRSVLAAQADESLAKLKQKRRTLSTARDAFLKEALADNPYVRISLEPYGRDASTLRRSFREAIEVPDDRFEDDILTVDNGEPQGGIVATLLKNFPADGGAAEFEKRLDRVKAQLAETCTGANKNHFGGHFRNYLEKRCSERPEFLDRLMVWFPEDTLQVEYSPKGDGKDFTPINRASAGQRAAAMLAFLLAHGNEPIVLDQPEDDLDNHLIYNLVVQQIRANKQRRQIIVVTHNPNIVVNGDAEMNHALDMRGGQCRVTERGSLQEKAMRKEVCDVMEGGRDAFEKRYRRLGRD